MNYTGPYEGDASVEAICKLARDIYLTVEMTVRDERGLALQNSGVLMDVINSSKGP